MTGMFRSGDGIDNRVIKARFYAGPMRLRRSRLTDKQSARLLEHFVAGTPARPAAELVGVNRNTARLFYHRLRVIIAQRLSRNSALKGGAEIGAARSGSTLVDKQGRDAPGEAPVFGLLARGNKVYTVMLPDSLRETSAPVPKARMRLDAVFYADAPGGREVLDVSGFHHQRVNLGTHLARGRPQIDSIENFWSQAKRHLRRYNGIPRQHLHLFLKECEWRFNYGSPRQLLKTLKSWMKSSFG